MSKNPVIYIEKASENNLKDLSMSFVKNHWHVVSGPSGSGKSSLVFDVLYHEANRKFMEALSIKSRQGPAPLEKARVESVSGLSPAIAIKQGRSASNPRSTVGTVTDMSALLRTLFSRCAQPLCPDCQKGFDVLPSDTIIDEIMELPERSRLSLMAPFHGSSTTWRIRLAEMLKRGYQRFYVHGEVLRLESEADIPKKINTAPAVIIDRVRLKKEDRSRISEAVELAIELSEGYLLLLTKVEGEDEREKLFSRHYSRPTCEKACGKTWPKPESRMFTHNHPRGACKQCGGMGLEKHFVPFKFFDPDKSLNQGGLLYFRSIQGSAIHPWMMALAEYGGFSLDTPLGELSEAQLDVLMHGSRGEEYELHGKTEAREWRVKRPLEGILGQAQRRYRDSKSEGVRMQLEYFMDFSLCSVCQGERLDTWPCHFYYASKRLPELQQYSLQQLLAWTEKQIQVESGGKSEVSQIALSLLKKLGELIKPFLDLGLSYLSLDRSLPSLSGGEESRLRLASQIQSGLSGLTYVFDEPSTGLHAGDVPRLINIFRSLTAQGNTVIVIDHNPDLMLACQTISEFGPGGGARGGELLFQGSPEKLATLNYPTSAYLRGSPIELKNHSKPPKLHYGPVTKHNINNLKISFVDGAINVLCGVSGSGKSTLLHHSLYPDLRNYFQRNIGMKILQGWEDYQRVYLVDASAIGQSRRSNPATYLGVFESIRQFYAQMGEAKERGLKASDFSFNTKGGRCDHCQGLGEIKIQMPLMPDLFLSCEVCQGSRYKSEILGVRFHRYSIADILNMSFDEAANLFKNIPDVFSALNLTSKLGLGYLKLGQRSESLSGGEAKRLKIALELIKEGSEKTIFILDEPSAGLHPLDCENLLAVLYELCQKGHTILLIEHSLQVIAQAEHILELGPGPGELGGRLIYSGSPAELIKENTPTGKALSTM